MEPVSGKTNGYRWIVTARHGLGDLLSACPEVVLGKCVVVTSFDSGPLIPTEDEVKQGWLVQHNLAIMPRVASLSVLPYDQYDEWYVFPTLKTPDLREVFVNYGAFTLQTISVSEKFAHMRNQVGTMADLKMLQHEADMQQNRVDSFWAQLDRVQPETYIADGDNLVFVTAEPHLFERVSKTFGLT